MKRTIKEVKTFFRRVDSDGNKALSPDEMVAFVEAKLEVNLEECLGNGDRSMCCADTGMTDMREICLDAQTMDGMRQVFEFLDTDNSGDLSLKEILSPIKAVFKDIFKQMKSAVTGM